MVKNSTNEDKSQKIDLLSLNNFESILMFYRNFTF
jgi:hypothetical protein